MFDLDAIEKIPNYIVKHGGVEHAYDPVKLAYKLTKELKGETDPDVVTKKVSQVFELSLDACEAVLLVQDFEKFSETHEAILKKVFGRTPSSPTTTESPQPNATSSQSAPEQPSASPSETSTP